MRYLRISAPHFTAAVIVGRAAAPIVSYMRTWSEERIVDYCKSKRWTVDARNAGDPQEELVFNIPGQPVRVRVRAYYDGAQWFAPDSFRRTLKMVDVIVLEEPKLGELAEGRLADEYDPDSYVAQNVAAADSFGGAYLVIGDRE